MEYTISMSWMKTCQFSGCDGYFSLKDYASFNVVAATDYRVIETNPNFSELRILALEALQCPVRDILAESKKIIIAHVKKIALNRRNRYSGDIERVKSLSNDVDFSQLSDIASYGLRSERHDPQELRKKLMNTGMTWEQATQKLVELGKMNPKDIKPVDYYVTKFKDKERFKDYNWQKFADALQELNSASQSISSTISLMDKILNAVHNTTVSPSNYLYGLIKDEPMHESDSFSESILTYMQDGSSIFPYLNKKRKAGAGSDIISELLPVANSSAQKLWAKYKMEQRVGMM